jgi:nucleotide-binding universal stress UspA family protein
MLLQRRVACRRCRAAGGGIALASLIRLMLGASTHIAGRPVSLWISRYALRTSWLSRSPEDMLFAMRKEPFRDAAHVQPAERSEARAPRCEHASRPAPAGLQVAPIAAAHVLARNSPASQPPEDHAERPAELAHTFNSVICDVAGDPTDEATRHQAALIASPGGTVEFVPAAQLTRHGERALSDSCEGDDLLALGGRAAAFAAVEQAPIPILIARRCPLGTEVTDTIVVPVDGSPESSRAVELAGSLAAAHGGSVTLLAAPAYDPALERAIAAGLEVLLRATGAAAHVFGEPRPPDWVIPPGAATLKASLVVLDVGRSPTERRTAALMVGAIGCSVLAVPRS